MRSQPNHFEVVSFVVVIVLGVANPLSPAVLDRGNYPAGAGGGVLQTQSYILTFWCFFMSPVINVNLHIE